MTNQYILNRITELREEKQAFIKRFQLKSKEQRKKIPVSEIRDLFFMMKVIELENCEEINEESQEMIIDDILN